MSVGKEPWIGTKVKVVCSHFKGSTSTVHEVSLDWSSTPKSGLLLKVELDLFQVHQTQPIQEMDYSFVVELKLQKFLNSWHPLGHGHEFWPPLISPDSTSVKSQESIPVKSPDSSSLLSPELPSSTGSTPSPCNPNVMPMSLILQRMAPPRRRAKSPVPLPLDLEPEPEIQEEEAKVQEEDSPGSDGGVVQEEPDEKESSAEAENETESKGKPEIVAPPSQKTSVGETSSTPSDELTPTSFTTLQTGATHGGDQRWGL
ncbi:hypothetical protein E1B28_009842 [Marasmius oreades]|uniref:Uncharacterized protein n=1 Tax=Marasmius oreades TaxID=181124 RepID=A0A9P7UQI8_9AGAR|nr:uncharacterized protein E1B28_009842 [Marasmius oreades]KAG7090752.1 hypothetical protein E1B28_009842 [Marasmius oreades]